MNEEMPKIEIDDTDYIDVVAIKKELVKLSIVRRTGKTPNKEIYNKFLKYLDMAYENNRSKSNIDNRIASIFKVIEQKYEDYMRIYNF